MPLVEFLCNAPTALDLDTASMYDGHREGQPVEEAGQEGACNNAAGAASQYSSASAATAECSSTAAAGHCATCTAPW